MSPIAVADMPMVGKGTMMPMLSEMMTEVKSNALLLGMFRGPKLMDKSASFVKYSIKHI